MTKKTNVILILICFVTVFFLLHNTVFAEWDPKEMIDSAGTTWVKDTKNEDIVKTTQTVMGTAINVIRVVGTGIAIIMITYVAIKYMSAAPSEKADFKKSATALVVGAVVLFASTNILTVIANFATKNI